MNKGDQVRVYPHGSPGEAAIGTVQLISCNERSIAVAFPHIPAFASPPIGIHPEHGIMFFAYRHEIGPWIELMGGGHYEIEAAV